MNRIQLAQLRDVAIEHLPAAQEKRAMLKKHWASETTYSNSLYLTAVMTLGQAGATAAEIAAAQLLEALGMWVGYDPNSPELKEFDPKDLRELAIRNIGDAVSTLGKVTGRDMAHLMPSDAPAAKVKTNTSPSGDDHDEILAELFDFVPVEALAKMFPTDNEATTAQWKLWAEKAKANGLINARENRKFNPYKAGKWFVSKGAKGWDTARLYRTLANNLPAHSIDKKHLLTGGIA